MSDTTLDTLKQALAPKTGMRRMPFPTESYEHPSEPLSIKRLCNLMIEAEPSDARTTAALVPTPGLVPFINAPGDAPIVLGAGPIKAMEGIPGVLYVASGDHFFRVSFGGALVIADLGSIGAPDSGTIPDYVQMVTIAIGRTATVVCVPPRCYACGHGATDPITQITVDFPGASSVAYQDGYFIFSSYGNYDTFFISAINDPFSLGALDFASSEGLVNALRRVYTHAGNLWLMGEAGIEIWYDAGVADFPFRRLPGSVLAYTVATPRSVAMADGSVFWLGREAIVYRSRGLQGTERVSSHGIEAVILAHGVGDVQSAFGYAQFGHEFYVLNFSTVTLVYDCNTKKWHNRSSDMLGATRWRIQDAVTQSGTPLAGDSRSGKLFHLSATIGTEDGAEMLRQFVMPPLWGGTVRAFLSRLEIEMETGTADSSGPVLVEWSDDGGYTWTAPRVLSAGAVGEVRHRVVTTRLGSFRQRVFRISKTGGRPSFYAVDADVVAGAVLMAVPVGRLEPPAADPPLNAEGQHSNAWTMYHQSVSDRLSTLAAQGGVTDGSNADAGQIGEVLSASALGVGLASGVAANIVSLPLTAGDWQIGGVVQFNPAGGTVTQRALAGVGPSALAVAEFVQVAGVTGAGAVTRLATPAWRVNTATATTVYLTAMAAFTVSTMAADGTITARRMR